jgi:hypothetical protein
MMPKIETSIGNVLLFSERVTNPYANAYKNLDYITGDSRKAAFANLAESGKFPGYVADVWYAPADGGAKRINRSTITLDRIFLTADEETI